MTLDSGQREWEEDTAYNKQNKKIHATMFTVYAALCILCIVHVGLFFRVRQ